jgi:SulP family sulfate permease
MNLATVGNEMTSGLTIALLMIPEAIAFSLWIGMMPKDGIKGSIVMSGMSSLFGGLPGLVSGTAGSTVSTIKSVATKYGHEYVFITVILAGILQLLIGFVGVYKLLDLVPQVVLSGFLIGLAWLIFQGQFIHLKEANLGKTKEKTDQKASWLPKKTILTTLFFTAIELFAMIFLSNTGIPYMKTLAPLLTISIMTAITYIFPKIHVQNVADRGVIKGAVPMFQIPNIEWSVKNIMKLVPYAMGMTLTGLLESIIMLKEIGKITNRIGNATQETFAQGFANIVSGATGGLGGCVLAGQSMMNAFNGSRSRISSITACVSLLLGAVLFTGVFEYISMPSIIAIMIYIAGQTAMAGDIKGLFRTVDKNWVVTIITVIAIIATSNLSIGTIVGTIAHYLLQHK